MRLYLTRNRTRLSTVSNTCTRREWGSKGKLIHANLRHRLLNQSMSEKIERRSYQPAVRRLLVLGLNLVAIWMRKEDEGQVPL